MTINDLLLLQPAISIIIVSFIIAFFITLVYKYTTNQHEMSSIRRELKELQEKAKEHKKEPEKMIEIQKELAEKNLTYMKHSFKPMMYTFLPIIIIFWWLSGIFKEIGVVLTIPFVGWGLNWIWTYIIFSLIFSMTIRKVMKIH